MHFYTKSIDVNKQRQQAPFQTIKSILLQKVEFLKQDTKQMLTLSLPLTLVPCHVVVGVSFSPRLRVFNVNRSRVY